MELVIQDNFSVLRSAVEKHDLCQHVIKPEHLKAYLELQACGPKYAALIHEVVMAILKEAQHNITQGTLQGKVIPFPGASPFLGGEGGCP